jgi:ADP-heptose:LPS heptosyltransferase
LIAIRLERELGASVIAVTTPTQLRSGSGAPEPGFYEEVAKHLPFRLEVYNDPSMWRVTAFLQGLNLFLVPDGGLFHMAAAAKVPTVGLFVTTDPNKWAPPMPWVSTLWGKGNREAITPDMVIAHVRERLLAHSQKNLLEI